MVTDSILWHLLSDKDSLHNYQNETIVTFADIKRRLFLLARIENRCIPDHYYRLNQTKSFEGISSVGDVLRLGLYRVAKDHLELRENRIYVKQEKQNEWQKLITYIPPLILQMAFLHIEVPITDKSQVGLLNYFVTNILPNSKYTALPYPFIPQLEKYIEEEHGLYDLHMHLNNSTETDIAWQDFLREPDKIYSKLKNEIEQPKVKEQFEQELGIGSPLDFKNLLLCARGIRIYFLKTIFPTSNIEFGTPEKLLKVILQVAEPITSKDNPFIYDSANHPFARLLGNEAFSSERLMSIEGLMYVLLFDYLAENPRESTASMFHFYLLIIGLSNRLLVQQTHQFGFEQFQKLTLNELRCNSEIYYRNRFLQLQGNELRNIRFLGGRFSPKKTMIGNQKLIDSITKGWKSLLAEIKKEVNYTNDDLPQLKLIAHFIKMADTDPDPEIRHKKLRYDVWTKAKVLALMKKNDSYYMKDIVAVDAASSEFDASPEVFAASFRYLRRNGFKHFTYHAGEDFFHIISGLRAVYEAIVFNGLSYGDRIGHGTVTGVSPELWIQNIGENMFISQGEYLDNLIFVHHLIIKNDIELLKKTLPLLENKIQELSYQIYKKIYPAKILEEAWLMRRFCPALLFSESKADAQILSVFDNDEWCDIRREVFDTQRDERVQLVKKYHREECREEYNKIIEIKVCQYFSVSDLEVLQLDMLKYMHKKEIVLETLPTSNIRIGQHHNMNTYHLWNWIKWEKEGHSIPPIVIGIDDAGIFATNIYNEFANIYCHLTCQCKMTHNAAMSLLEQLDRNGKIYNFH